MRLLLVLLIISPLLSFSQSDLNFMTFNIRYATPADGINQWENRKETVAATISYFEADICGLQEATKAQIDFLEESLIDYSWIGVGRDDGKEKGEYSPIFYNKEKLSLDRWETIWLSETPNVPSKSWDAALPRIATIAHFITKSDNKEFIIINTHYDHLGVLARQNSSKLLVKEISRLKQFKKPIILMGDLNCTINEEPYKVFIESGLKNTFDISETAHFGPVSTFNGFGPSELENRQIDYIFVSPEITVKKHASISQTWKGRFASDHFAVITTINH